MQAEQQTAPERLFVRVVDRGAEAIVLSQPQGWDVASLETGSIRLADGTLVQVGKSTEARDDLLARFRAALGLVTLSVVLIALTGGVIATQTAVKPIRQLTEAVQRIIATGRTDSRVPIAEHRDSIDELSALFNAMLDKIEGLVTGMRGALDNVSHDLRTPMTRLRARRNWRWPGRPTSAATAKRWPTAWRKPIACSSCSRRSWTSPKRRAARCPSSASPWRWPTSSRAPSISIGTPPTPRASRSRASADDGVRASVDRTRLEQVAANLLDNAIKYTPAGGRVEVSAGREGGRAVLRVSDTGLGIPADEQPGSGIGCSAATTAGPNAASAWA